jgi:hypothetical protein
MKSVEIVLRRRENVRGDKSKIHCKYHSVSPCTTITCGRPSCFLKCEVFFKWKDGDLYCDF